MSLKLNKFEEYCEKHEKFPVHLFEALSNMPEYGKVAHIFLQIYRFNRMMNDNFGKDYESVPYIDDDKLCKTMSELLHNFADKVLDVAKLFEDCD